MGQDGVKWNIMRGHVNVPSQYVASLILDIRGSMVAKLKQLCQWRGGDGTGLK